MFFEIIKMSFLNVIHNKLRSFLTVLGVLIGVSSIIALTSIIQGVTDDVTGSVLSLGGTTVTTAVPGIDFKKGLEETDLESFLEIENVTGINPKVSSSANAENGNLRMEDISVSGVNYSYFNENEDVVAYGRELNYFDVDSRNKVAIVGDEILNELFYATDPLGKTIKIGGISYVIVGVLDEEDSDTVIMPYTTVLDNFGIPYINQLEVYIEDEDLLDETTESIENNFLEIFDEDDDAFSIISYDMIVEIVEEMTGTMTLMLAGIAAISLVVGGIGIMNMMLVTVTERTREIGLRKSLGATPASIQMQFILEALFLSVLGGFLGLLLGLAIAVVGTSILQVDFVLVSYAIPLAFGFSGIVGLVFGYMPARKASLLNPIDALRSV